MDILYYNYLIAVNNIVLRYRELEERIKKLPAGRLEIINSIRDGKRYYCFNNGKKTYIPLNDTKKIKELSDKKELVSIFTETEKHLKRILCADTVNLIYSFSNIPKKSFPISVSEENYRRDELKHKTAHGEIVRSKSEVIDTNIVYETGATYCYEKRLMTKDGAIFPDLTIKHPITGETYYFEHLGMMDKEDYVINWVMKKGKYKSIGITEDNYLFATIEENGIYDANEAKEIIESKLTYKRFMPIIDFMLEKKIISKTQLQAILAKFNNQWL